MVTMVTMVVGYFLPKKKVEKKIKYLKSIEKRNLEVSTARISGVTIDCFPPVTVFDC